MSRRAIYDASSHDRCCARALDVVNPAVGTVWSCCLCGRCWVYRPGKESLFTTPRVTWWAERQGERKQRERIEMAKVGAARAAQRAAIRPGARAGRVRLGGSGDGGDHRDTDDAIVGEGEEAYDWEAEAGGLAYMILSSASRYRSLNVGEDGRLLPARKRDLGGDSELLRAAVLQAEAWVSDPLTATLAQSDGVVARLTTPGEDFDWEDAARKLAGHILTIADRYRALILDHQGRVVQLSWLRSRAGAAELYGAVVEAENYVNGPLHKAITKRGPAAAPAPKMGRG